MNFTTDTGRRKRFLEHLKDDYDIDEEELKHYRYCGGSGKKYDEVSKFTKLYFHPKKVKMPSTNSCVCGQLIKIKYFITDAREKKNILVLGSECIKSFTIYGKKRFCVECDAVHKNRNYNRCNACLTTCNCGGVKKKGSDKCALCLSKICECGKPKKSMYKTCWDCKPKFACSICHKIMYKNFPTCWDCKFGAKCEDAPPYGDLLAGFGRTWGCS
tara:strand:- start:50 stop:694 length:645 start_codon:yes stop_codon:yes gene_type:complete